MGIAVNQIFYTKWRREVNSCLQMLQFFIKQFDENIEETTKYGMACFLYKNKPKFYLGVDLKRKQEPYILFVEGAKIEDDRLEQGKRKRMKIYRVDPSIDLDKNELFELLTKGIS